MIDVFNGVKILGAFILFSFLAIYVSNMATVLLTYLSPVALIISYPFRVFGYHNASFALFMANLAANLIVRLIV